MTAGSPRSRLKAKLGSPLSERVFLTPLRWRIASEPVPRPVLDGLLVSACAFDVGLGQLAMDRRPHDFEAPPAFIQIARLPSVSRQLRPVRERDAPIPSLSAAYARDFQHTSDRDAVPDHHIIVGRGLAADDRAAHGELVGGRSQAHDCVLAPGAQVGPSSHPGVSELGLGSGPAGA